MIVKATIPTEPVETLADLVKRLGGVPLDRILLHPAPGTATEEDLIAALEAPRKRICELVDGVLVEKPMGAPESMLAAFIIHVLMTYLDKSDLGIVIGADGPIRFRLGLVFIPDVSFVSWDRIPGDAFPADPVAKVIPNLAVEVLSKSNTTAEIKRKLKEYFKAGVELAWVIDPKKQIANVYTSPTKKRQLARDGILDGGTVLPGFKLSLKELFAHGKRPRGQR